MFISVWELVVYLAIATCGFAVWKLYCKFDERREDRRKKAFTLGAEFASRGAKRLAKIFTCYGAGDYSGVIEEVKRIADNIADGVPVLDMEFRAIAKSYQDEELVKAVATSATGPTHVATSLAVSA
jgi:hypothetical protein